MIGNRENSKISKIIRVAGQLPLFTLDDLASVETNKQYLRILLSRYVKSGAVLRLKKGVYVAKNYIDRVERAGRARAYAEFLTGVLYEPSYISLEYILHQHGLIPEAPVAVTAVARKKTAVFSTPFSTYRYHTIKPTLFTGFTSKRDGDYIIFRASAAKALFDFLYFRKSHLENTEAIRELRININMFKKSDKRELAHYVKLEGSIRMKHIFTALWKN